MIQAGFAVDMSKAVVAICGTNHVPTTRKGETYEKEHFEVASCISAAVQLVCAVDQS